jgi:hypothetical protein
MRISRLFTAAIVALVGLAFLCGFAITAEDLAAYEGRVIKNIEIVRKNVFDDLIGETIPFYYRWANSLHIKTRERIVKSELLFDVGERLDIDKAVESERNLRLRGFIGEAFITAKPNGPDGVDLTVTTIDYWSTKISVFSELGGGDYIIGAAASEVNFLGYGQTVELSAQTGSEQDGYSFLIEENRLAGSRLATSLFYADYTLGEDLSFSFSRPQYSVSVSTGLTTRYQKNPGIGRLFFQGREFFRYNRTLQRFDLSSVYSSGRFRRADFYFDYAYDSRQYSPEDINSPYNHLIPPDEIRSYPSIGIGLSFIKYNLVRFLDEAGTPEDLKLGASLKFSIGRSLSEFGADFQGTRPEISLSILAKPAIPVFIGAKDVVCWWRYGGRNVEIRHRTEAMLYYKTGSTQVLALRGLTDFAWRQKRNYQIILGGGNGLRGYSVYEFSGSRLALGNIEYRVYFPLEILTVRFGAAAFFDIGRVWYGAEKINLEDLRSDFGIGLRFGLTRSSTSRVLRLDLAKSLSDNEVLVSFATGMVFSLKIFDGHE